MKKQNLNEPLTGPTITEYASPRGLRALSAAAIAQAVKDVKSRSDLRRKVSAIAWLTDPDPHSTLHLFKDILDAPHMDPLKMIVAGGARRLQSKNYHKPKDPNPKGDNHERPDPNRRFA